MNSWWHSTRERNSSGAAPPPSRLWTLLRLLENLKTTWVQTLKQSEKLQWKLLQTYHFFNFKTTKTYSHSTIFFSKKNFEFPPPLFFSINICCQEPTSANFFYEDWRGMILQKSIYIPLFFILWGNKYTFPKNFPKW